MPSRELEYQFEDLRLSGDGLVANGTALLVDCGPGYPGEWMVDSIVLSGGQRLKRGANGILGFPEPFLDMLFKIITAQIENDKTPVGKNAAMEWADYLDGNAPAPVPSVFKRRVGMPMVYGASLGESR